MMSVEHLRLRIPGLSSGEARRLSEEVVQRLADRLPERGTPLHLGALDLRVTVPAGTARDRLVDLVADAILERLP